MNKNKSKPKTNLNVIEHRRQILHIKCIFVVGSSLCIEHCLLGRLLKWAWHVEIFVEDCLPKEAYVHQEGRRMRSCLG